MVRRGVAGIAVLAGLLAFAAPASAQDVKASCKAKALQGAECGIFGVPLDYDRPEGEQLGIGYVKVPARRTARGTVVVVPGGPGQAATPLASGVAGGPLAVLRDDYDLVFADPRGSGKSGALTCAEAPKGVFPSASGSKDAAACGAELGERRQFFTTYEDVLDLESVRRHFGVERLIPLGISYGGEVAGAYARRFPDRVQALVLDSTSPIEGEDALGSLPQLALPRVLKDVCFPPGCEDLLGDPLALLGRAVERMKGGLRGHAVLASGKRRATTVRLEDLHSLVLASDVDPFLRSALPSVIQAAGRGDAAPMIRLLLSGGSASAGEVNEVRLLATLCTGARLPWAPDSDPAGRPALLARALEDNAARYAPFPVSAVAPAVPAALCVGWPATPPPPFTPSPGHGPDVPVLVLAGRLDLRTPLEDQRRAALQYPSATVVAVPEVGHSVLSTDRSNCARVTLRAFLEGKSVGRCTRRSEPVPLALPAIRRLSEIPAGSAAGEAPAKVRRTMVAVDLTFRDVSRDLLQFAGESPTGNVKATSVDLGGLRGGHLTLSLKTLAVKLDRYEAVEGVRVSGTIGPNGRGVLAITGRGATGTVTVGRRVFTGTLDGVAVTYRPLTLPGTL